MKTQLQRLANLAMRHYPEDPLGFETAIYLDLAGGHYEEAARHLAVSPLSGVRIKRALTSPPPRRYIKNGAKHILSYQFVAKDRLPTGKVELAALLDLANLANDERDQEAALKILRSAEQAYPNEASILLLRSKIYRADGDFERAVACAREAYSLSPLRSTMRLLFLTAENELLDQAETFLDELAALSVAKRAKVAPGWNRLSVLFPERAEQFAQWRTQVKKRLTTSIPKTTDELDAAITRGVRLRWLKETRKLVRTAKLHGVRPSPDHANWLKLVEMRLGPFADMAPVAFQNEQREELIGFQRGRQISVNAQEERCNRIVEFFIPQPFYTLKKYEKPSYGTVRNIFLLLAEDILSRDDIILVPRHQYNWRNAFPKINAWVISYHTAGIASRLHLRLQESPLSGRCSVDHQGYACFASIADNYAAIDLFTDGISESELLRNRQVLFDTYVSNNVSKYLQAEDHEAIVGDYVFVALQISTDIVATRAYMKGIELLRCVVDHYRGTTTKVVVKRHPFCTGVSIQRELNRLTADGKIILSEGSIHTLISGAKAVFTVNSSVGLEALMHLKPVIVTGACDYSYAAKIARNSEELEALLNDKLEFDVGRTLKFLYFYKNRYTIASDPKAIGDLLDSWLASH